jgi:hypothetical protein
MSWWEWPVRTVLALLRSGLALPIQRRANARFRGTAN